MLKRKIAVFLSLCMLISFFPAMAQYDACVSLSNQTADAGESVELTLELSGCEGFVNLGLEISYDCEVMTLVSVSNNAPENLAFTPSQSTGSNPYILSWNSASDFSYNGNLATFIFKISDTAPAGEYYVGLSCYKGRDGDYIDGEDVNYDENDRPLDLHYKSGCINISYSPIIRPEPSEVNTYNGNTYMVFDRHVSWKEASEQCEEAGGHLLTVTSAGENAFVQSLCANTSSSQYYLGAEFNGGIWSWVSNESFVYKNWQNGVPDNSGSEVSRLTMQRENGRWKSETGEAMADIGFVCEWEGENSGSDSSYWVEFACTKDIYAVGEELSVDAWLYTDDYVIKLYENEYSVSGFDNSMPGTYSVTVSYGEYSQEFEVTVVDDKEAEPIITHVVQAIATEGVTIFPSGYCEVTEGTVMKYVIGTKEGYSIDGVYVNGEAVSIYDSNLDVTVTGDMVIEVSGRKKTYSIEHTVIGNGSVELSETDVEHGGSCSARIIADKGYIISDVAVDGKSVGACKYYSFSNIKENHSITATFEKIIETVTVRVEAGEGGKAAPSKSVVNAGGSAVFTVVPDHGYHALYAISGDEILKVSKNKISIDNVTEDKVLSVVFEKDVFSVSVAESEGVDLAVRYNGQSLKTINVPYMETVDIVIDVLDGYKLNMLYINNTPVKAKKIGDKLIYSAVISKNTVISARCVKTLTSIFNEKVLRAGVAADINADNAADKKAEFMLLAEEYALLSDEEKTVCTSSYATVLAVLERANAYILLNESDIVAAISNLPSCETLTAENYRDWKAEIDNIFNEYENLTYLSKSLIDYELVSKLSKLKIKAEELEKESKGIISYFYGIIESVPDAEKIDADKMAEAYSRLMLAEETYNNLSEENKKYVSEEKYSELITKHGRIATQIQKLYVAPFTGKVLRCSGVSVADSAEDAEAKRVVIYDLMNEYHSFPAFIQEQIASETVQRLNGLYENASIKVSAAVNNLPVDMNGDFDEEVDLVLTEPELDNFSITTTTGKAVYQAIDVKMYADDREIQPSSKIRIKMEIKEELHAADVSVVYVNDEGAVYDVQGEVIEENDKYYVVFFIDHFSSFAVLYNESEAPETVLSFDTEYAEIGDKVTANVTGVINTNDYILFVAGYSSAGEVTFVKKGSGSVTVTVLENTKTVKAMLWDKNMTPIVNPITLTVAEVELEEMQAEISFDAKTAKIGDKVTASVTGVINADDYTLFVAGYSSAGEVTFVKKGSKSVTVTVLENTKTVKAMLWDKNMTPIVNPITLTVAEDELEEMQAEISFDTKTPKIGDKVTASVTGVINADDYTLFVAGYSSAGEVTFVKKGSKSVTVTVLENTKTVKAMLWDRNMTPIVNSETISVF